MVALLVALWLPATLASAQWDASTEQGAYTTATGTPSAAPPDQMVADTPLARQFRSRSQKKGWKPVGFTWSLGIGVPIALDVPRRCRPSRCEHLLLRRRRLRFVRHRWRRWSAVDADRFWNWLQPAGHQREPDRPPSAHAHLSLASRGTLSGSGPQSRPSVHHAARST